MLKFAQFNNDSLAKDNPQHDLATTEPERPARLQELLIDWEKSLKAPVETPP